MRKLFLICVFLLVGCQTSDEPPHKPADVRQVELQWKERGKFKTVIDLGADQPRMWLTNDVSCDYAYYYVEEGFKGKWSLNCSDGEAVDGGFVTLEGWNDGIVGVGDDKAGNQVIITVSSKARLTLPG